LKDPEEQLRFYIESGVKVAGIKMGPEGSMISDGKTIYKIGVYDVPVVDTCGAGDAFIAGFLYGNVQGYDLLETSRFATAVSNISVGAIGATTAIKKKKKVREFMQNNRLDYEAYAY
jgi:sugar/nucleoside kinase (ribokinase family)